MREPNLLALLCLALPACGGDTPVLIVEPAVHDFGRVRYGQTRVTKFRIENTSDRDVEMVLKPNCGCFKVLEGGRRTLEPGEASEFRLRFDAGSIPAQVLKGKRLDVVTDHPRGNTTVPLTGEIYSVAKLHPAVTRVGRLGADASKFEARRIQIRPAVPGATLEVTSVKTSPTPSYVFDIQQEVVENGVDLVVRQKDDVRRPRGNLLVVIAIGLRVTSSHGTESVTLSASVTGFWDVDTHEKRD